MPGQQFTPEQRSFMALEYHKLRGQYNCINRIKESFNQKFQGVQLPTKNTIKGVWKKQMTSMEELKDRIRLEVSRLDRNMLKRACQDVRNRCERLITTGGSFIE